MSKHLKVLERAGLITRGRDARWRPCQLDPAPLRDVAAWTEQYRGHWEQRFDHLDHYVEQLTKEQRHAEEERHAQAD